MFSTTMRTSRATQLATVGVLSALLVAGCGSTGTTASKATGSSGAGHSTASASYGPPATGPHNAADVTFVTDMLPHHAQAVEMADMALSRDTNTQVKGLAQQITSAQAPEISMMSGWLASWGKAVPTSVGSTSHDMSGMAGMGGDGMMSTTEMTALDAASGTRFATLWLTGMVRHHTGAVAMARTELSSGQNAQAKALATRIIASQSAEIATMSSLLSTIG